MLAIESKRFMGSESDMRERANWICVACSAPVGRVKAARPLCFGHFNVAFAAESRQTTLDTSQAHAPHAHRVFQRRFCPL
jgi:hypothetical protein